MININKLFVRLELIYRCLSDREWNRVTDDQHYCFVVRTFRNRILVPLSLAFVEIALCLSFQPRPLFLLALQPYICFGLLHQIIPDFYYFDNLLQVLSFSSFKTSPSFLWPSFGPYSCSVQICNLLNYFYVFQSFKTFPTFYFLCFHTFNNIFSFYRLLRFFIISYSPFFLKHNWSTYRP